MKNFHAYETQSVDEARLATEYYIEEWSKDKDFLNNLEIEWRKAEAGRNTVVRELEQVELSKLSDDDLLKFYKEILRVSVDLWAYIGITEAVGVYEEMDLPAKMKEEIGLSESEYTEIVIGFTQSQHKTFSKDYEARAGAIHELIKVKSNAESEIEDLIKNYYWIRTGYHGAPILTKDEILKEAELFKQPDEKYLSRDELIKKYNLSERALLVFDFVALMSFWRDERKRISLPLMFWTFKICDEFASRRSVDRELVYNLTDQEFYDFVGGADIPTQTSKEGDLSFVIHNEDIELFRGEDHNKIFETFFDKFAETIDQISGTVAYKCEEKVVGKARIINNPVGVQLSKDEILITAMTRPEFVLLMRQACAVITDQGGLTSHAAIVARELKVPCIIGTKIATKIVKDGDTVELDTASGIVKILKQAS